MAQATGHISATRRFVLRAGLAVGATIPLFGFRSLESVFAPSAELWSRWTAHDESSSSDVDYTGWSNLLGRYLHTAGQGLALFDYAAVTAADRHGLKEFLSEMSRVPVSALSRRAQLPFWVNTYNALTVDVVLDHYPVASIRDIDITPGLFADGPWGKTLLTVEGENVSLNDIEHRILRPIWRDPRLHYVLNCAAIGCPNLRAPAYRPETMETDLEQAARAYVNDPRGVSIRSGRVTVSRIYDWFVEDFGGNEAGVIAHILRYAEPHLAERLSAIGTLHASRYNWRLNDLRATNADLSG